MQMQANWIFQRTEIRKTVEINAENAQEVKPEKQKKAIPAFLSILEKPTVFTPAH